MDRRERVEGRGDPRETKERKQVVEEEVRKGKVYLSHQEPQRYKGRGKAMPQDPKQLNKEKRIMDSIRQHRSSLQGNPEDA